METAAAQPTDLVEILNYFYLLAFTVGMVVGATLTAVRLVRYYLAPDQPPTLLIRDVIARVTLCLPFVGILLFRVLGLDPTGEWWGAVWFISSGALACVGVWVYVYYEWFIIER